MTFRIPRDLHAMMTYKRPHLSESETAWIARFISPNKPTVLGRPGEGALMISVPLADGGQPSTLFSCHTDTMHRKAGRQSPVFQQDGWMVTGEDDCLGADDGAGAWILLRMIEAKVPGVYLFHRGEERGGIGSRWMAKEQGELLRSFKRAIAFDRRGSTDVITHQRGQRCCSQAFAEALSLGLNTADETFLYEPCDGGSFTDTANYVDLIPECTNVACGYMSEHGPGEKLHIPHLLALAEACIKVDWESLPTERVAGSYESKWKGSAFPSYGAGGFGQRGLPFDGHDTFDEDDARYAGWLKNRTSTRRVSTSAWGPVEWPTTPEGLKELSEDDMIGMCWDQPDEFVYLARCAMGLEDFEPVTEDIEDDTDDAVPSDEGRLPHGMS